MFHNLAQVPVRAAQAVFASAHSSSTTLGAPSGCELNNGIKQVIGNAVVQVRNAVPTLVYYAFFFAGVIMIVLSATGRLGRVGGILGGVIGGVIVISIAGTAAHIFAPSKC